MLLHSWVIIRILWILLNNDCVLLVVHVVMRARHRFVIFMVSLSEVGRVLTHQVLRVQCLVLITIQAICGRNGQAHLALDVALSLTGPEAEFAAALNFRPLCDKIIIIW